MSTPFNSHRGLIIIPVEIEGPLGSASVNVAVDTGSTHTMIGLESLIFVGYDPALSRVRHRITTVSGVEYAPRIVVSKLNALGEDRFDFPVVAHTLPQSASARGLLGIDFFRNRRLTFDFRSGQIELI